MYRHILNTGFLVLLILNSTSIFSQNITSSPYSRYGLGDLSLLTNGQLRAMGDISIGMRDPYHLNLTNASSLTSIDTINKFGSPFIFEYSMMNKISNLANNNQSITKNDININYLAFGFPYIKNIWYGSVIIAPYSSTGYKININEDINNIGNVDYFYYGSGGINRMGISNGFKPHKYFSLGINANYLFGYLRQTNTLIFNDNANALNYQIEKNTRISKWVIDMGMQFHYSYVKSEKSHTYCFGAIFGNESKLSATRDIFSGITNGSSYESVEYNTFIDTILYQTDIKGDIILPLSFGFGFSYNFDQKLVFGVDYFQQNWEDASFFNETDSLANSNKISAGFEYTPNRFNSLNGFGNLLKRTSYRIGGFYSNTYLQFPNKEEQLKDYGISFGLGIPLKKTNSSFNIFAKIGQMGTKNNNLIQDTYGIIGINISWYDIWFVKRKYD